MEHETAQFAHIIMIKRSTMELFSIVFVRPFNVIQSSILKRSGNAGRDNLKAIAEVDIVSAFVVEVSKEMLDN